MKAIIGGIQSNLANGVVWFNVRPNFFISINDPNIENTIPKIKRSTSVFEKDLLGKSYSNTEDDLLIFGTVF